MSIRPAKKLRIERVQEECRSLVQEQDGKPRSLFQEQEEKLQHKDKALQVAMKMVCDITKVPSNWKSMPPELRNDPTAATQMIVGDSIFLRRSDVPEEFLQNLLPNLLENHRQASVRLCEERFLTFEEVNPTPQEWRESVKLSMRALRRGLVAEDLTDAPALTREVLSDALKQNYLQWSHIPTHLQNDEDFCRSLLDLESPQDTNIPWGSSREDSLLFAVMEIFDLHPRLYQDRQVWEEIIKSNKIPIYRLFEEDYLPADADLVEQACNEDISVLKCIDQLAFADFVQKKVNDKAKNLTFVSTHFIEAFPDFVTSKLANLCREVSDLSIGYIQLFAENIPPMMWNDEDFTHTWFEVGLPLVDVHPSAWRADRDKFLLVAEKCPDFKWKSYAFAYAALELRNDVEFVTQVMQFEPSLFQFASKTLRTGNYKLAMWALSEPRFVDLCRDVIYFGGPEIIILSAAKLEEFRARAADELALHNTFVNPFLCGVCSSNRSSVLWNLNQQRGLVGAIGDFVGIPRGKHLCNIRKVLDNLSASDGNEDGDK